MAVTVSSALSYSDLRAIVEDYGAPFNSLAQVNTFLKAAWILRGREPSETEEFGVRVNKRDLLDQINEANTAREIFNFADHRVNVIVPTDCLY